MKRLQCAYSFFEICKKYLTCRNRGHLQTRFTLWFTSLWSVFRIITWHPPLRMRHLFITWGCAELLWWYESWEPSPVPKLWFKGACMRKLSFKMDRWYPIELYESNHWFIIYSYIHINCIKKTKLLPSIHSWYFVITRCSIELKSMQVAEAKYINILIWLSSCLWSNEEVQYKNRNLTFGHKTLHASLISQRC